jgi:hypothetical protein
MAGLLYVLMIAQFPDKSTKTLVKMPSYPPRCATASGKSPVRLLAGPGFPRLSKKHFDSLGTPSFLQNCVFAKNVALLPAALENQGLQRLFI